MTIWVRQLNSIMNRIFVYGTLKRGLPNHSLLLDEQNGQASFVAEGFTSEKYTLVVYKEYKIPFLLNTPGEGKKIEGEVWDVDDKMLKQLDKLEMHPDWYTRFQIDILASRNDEKSTMKCWTYLLCDFDPKLAEYEHISSYTNSDGYVGRTDRTMDFDPWSFKKK